MSKKNIQNPNIQIVKRNNYVIELINKNDLKSILNIGGGQKDI